MNSQVTRIQQAALEAVATGSTIPIMIPERYKSNQISNACWGMKKNIIYVPAGDNDDCYNSYSDAKIDIQAHFLSMFGKVSGMIGELVFSIYNHAIFECQPEKSPWGDKLLKKFSREEFEEVFEIVVAKVRGVVDHSYGR